MSENQPITYASAGVNIELGDDASKVLYNAAKLTWPNRNGRIGQVDSPAFADFSGVRVARIGGLPKNIVMGKGLDGVGTKMEIAERLGDHTTIAHDLIAMVVDDAVVRGAEPVWVGSILDVNSLGSNETSHIDFVKQLAVGYINAANAARVAIINGEVAELGSRVGGYGPFNYNWGASCTWFADESRLLTGKEIHPGQYIVSLKENGFRSNGLSLVRKVMKSKFGEEWHKSEEGKLYAKQVLAPSIIYCAAICDMNGGAMNEPKANITGIAHITGGGIPGKLGRMLKPSGYGAVLDNLHQPPEVMKKVQELGNIQNDIVHKTWNMGNGMLVATTQPDKVIAVAKILHDLDAIVAGTITEKPGIELRTYTGKTLTF